MSKKISADIRKKVACTLITSLVVGSSCGLVSADNGFDNANYKNIGYVSVVGEVGIKGNAGFISTGKGDAGGKSYGVSQFTSKGGGASANGFVKWLKKNYPKMGKNFDGVGKAGSASFDNAWKKTYNENKDEFGRVQMEYTGMNYVDPFVNKAKSQFGIDFKSTRALLELAYSTTVQFGVNGTLTVLENAGVNSNMSEVEILENATKEKISSVGTYKFLGCSQDVRNSVKKRFARELEEFKDIVEGTANIEGIGKVTLDDLVSGETNNTNSPLDDLVNGETDNTNSPLDDLVNGEDNNTNSPLDDLVNGEDKSNDSDKEPTVEDDNKEELKSDDSTSKEDNKKDDIDLNEGVQDTSIEDANNSVGEELVEDGSAQEPMLDDLVNEDSSEELNSIEDNSSNKVQEDTSDNTSIEENKEDNTKDSKDEVENATFLETVIKDDTVLSLEEKLENNMFGKLFKMTREIMENENGVDGVRAMYDLV